MRKYRSIQTRIYQYIFGGKAERENYLQEDVGNRSSNLRGSHARTSEGVS